MAGLPWIEIETDLPTHPKSVRLALKLGDNRAWTYMVQLWLWCAEQVPTGRLEGEDAVALIAFGAGWTGDASRFVTAGIESGFIEKENDSLILHGLAERLTAHIAKREKDKKRQQKRRARIAKRFGAPVVTRDVRVTDGERPAESPGNSNPNSNPNDQQRSFSPKASPPARSKAADKEPADPRHHPIRLMLARVYAEVKASKDMPWGPRHGKELSLLLAAVPGATIEEFERRWRRAMSLRAYPGTSDPMTFIKRFPELVPPDGTAADFKAQIDPTRKAANEF